MKQILVIIIFLIASSSLGIAQHLSVSEQYAQYDADRLPATFHKSRRDSVLKYMAKNGVALFVGAAEKNRANDVNYEFHQDPNFYYLTGHIQPNAALLLINGKNPRQILFVDKKVPAQETWTGVRLGVDGAKELLGFTEAYVIDSLPSMLSSVLQKTDTFYYTLTYPNIKSPILDSTMKMAVDLYDLAKKKYSNVVFQPLSDVLSRLRCHKTREELDLLRKAVLTSNSAHNQILRDVRAGWYEYEIQALGEYIFKKNGCEYTGYPCIVGSGNNSTILHYETNRRQTKDGDFIEMDIAGEYHGYSADITRSYPVNGTFTPEQRAIYDIVLEAQDSGIAAARAGNLFKAPHNAALSVIRKGLMKLGIIKDPTESFKYFMHGTSHYLGLDVHDAGAYGNLEPNEVITVEPGIYIKEGSPCDPKWWKIGCRIEDDILITNGDPINLSESSPRKAEDIEAMMKKGKQ